MPADEDVKAALAEIAEHPEITLSRREILRFILVEPTKRSEEIQTILKLDDIGQTRGALNTAQNKLQTAQRTAGALVQTARTALQQHLQIATLLSADVLEAVNKRRKVLGLPEIAELTADTKLDSGLSDTAKTPEFNMLSALRDLKALSPKPQRDFRISLKLKRLRSWLTWKSWRLIRRFWPLCSGARLSRKGLIWWKGQSVRSAIPLERRAASA